MSKPKPKSKSKRLPWKERSPSVVAGITKRMQNLVGIGKPQNKPRPKPIEPTPAAVAPILPVPLDLPPPPKKTEPPLIVPPGQCRQAVIRGRAPIEASTRVKVRHHNPYDPLNIDDESR
jgi:hypothetical protein